MKALFLLSFVLFLTGCDSPQKGRRLGEFSSALRETETLKRKADAPDASQATGVEYSKALDRLKAARTAVEKYPEAKMIQAGILAEFAGKDHEAAERKRARDQIDADLQYHLNRDSKTPPLK